MQFNLFYPSYLKCSICINIISIILLIVYIKNWQDSQREVASFIRHKMDSQREVTSFTRHKMDSQRKVTSFIRHKIDRQDFFIIRNYRRALYKPVYEGSITYTTHADYTFLDNLIPLLKRWNGPISIAVYAPGSDLYNALKSIEYLRECTNGSSLVMQYVTFHVYFPKKHSPENVSNIINLVSPYCALNCSKPPPYLHVNKTYRQKHELPYPINIGRNIARENSGTHYIFPSDIELLPSPNIIPNFIEMIKRNEGYLLRKNPRVFPLHIFEIKANATIPDNKTALLSMLLAKTAVRFHNKICPKCHTLPFDEEWMLMTETKGLRVSHVGNHTGRYNFWEPIFIGTNSDPFYDERLTWEGLKDKITQGFELCAQNYDFLILDNAFLVHKPGIKKKGDRKLFKNWLKYNNNVIKLIISPDLRKRYNEGECMLW